MTARCKKERGLPVRLALGFCGTVRDLWILARYGLVMGVLLGAQSLIYALLSLGLRSQQTYKTLRALVYLVALSLFFTTAFAVGLVGVWLLPHPYPFITSAVFGLVFGGVLWSVVNEVLDYAQQPYTERKEPAP